MLLKCYASYLYIYIMCAQVHRYAQHICTIAVNVQHVNMFLAEKTCAHILFFCLEHRSNPPFFKKDCVWPLCHLPDIYICFLFFRVLYGFSARACAHQAMRNAHHRQHRVTIVAQMTYLSQSRHSATQEPSSFALWWPISTTLPAEKA